MLFALITVAIIEWNGILRARDSAIAQENTPGETAATETEAGDGNDDTNLKRAAIDGENTTVKNDHTRGSSLWTWTMGEALLYLSISALLAGCVLVMYAIVKRRKAANFVTEEIGGVELQRLGSSPTNESALMLSGSGGSNSRDHDANTVFAMPMLVYL